MSSEYNGMILAAGEGRRLRPLTRIRAKPAVPFMNHPLIHYSVELLRRSGIEDIVVNLHHLPETVTEALADLPGNFKFSTEPVIQGTAGALSWARELLLEKPLVLSNGKIYFEEDLSRILNTHRKMGAPATLVVVPYDPGGPFNPILVTEDDSVAGFARTRGDFSGPFSPWVFTGVHVIEPEILDFIPKGTSDIVVDVYSKMLEQGIPIKVFKSDAYWCECSTPKRYLEKSLDVLARYGSRYIGPLDLAPNCSGSVVGRGAHVPDSTRVENSIIWKGVRLGTESIFDRVIVTEGVGELPSNWELKNAIVTPFLSKEQSTPIESREGEFSVWPLESN